MNVNRRNSERRTQLERSTETRRALIDAARQMFSERGYSDSSAQEIVQLAGVTRGALYHHFEDKRDLFRVVVEEIERKITEEVLKAMQEGANLPEQSMAGIYAFLDACTRPDVRQILLLDGPSVLGWKGWREMDARHSLVQIEWAIERLAEADLIEPQPVKPLAYLVYGMVMEAGLYIASSNNQEEARAEIGESLARFLGGPRDQNQSHP